jgi:hypothetical protein
MGSADHDAVMGSLEVIALDKPIAPRRDCWIILRKEPVKRTLSICGFFSMRAVVNESTLLLSVPIGTIKFKTSRTPRVG